MVSTHLKKKSQIGSFPQVGVNIKNIWVATTQILNPVILRILAFFSVEKPTSSLGSQIAPSILQVCRDPQPDFGNPKPQRGKQKNLGFRHSSTSQKRQVYMHIVPESNCININSCVYNIYMYIHINMFIIIYYIHTNDKYDTCIYPGSQPPSRQMVVNDGSFGILINPYLKHGGSQTSKLVVGLQGYRHYILGYMYINNKKHVYTCVYIVYI